MRASNFRKFKKILTQRIKEFSIEADQDISDVEPEMAIHRHSAAEILVWILNRTGATLRKSQLVEAWGSIVTKCWNLMDFTAFTEQDREMILGDIDYYKARLDRKNNSSISRDSNLSNREVPVASSVQGGIVVTRVRKSDSDYEFERYPLGLLA